ncbi:hypothetical protein COB72_07560 [bacterium]|nr:MAG: hypothetical protein COB72_07560 [bacterium]
MSVTESSSPKIQRIICIHCKYERALDDGIVVCPECGETDLVHENHLVPRLRRLRIYVWGEIIMTMLLAVTISAMAFSNIFVRFGIFLPLLFIAATIQGFIGIFISGATFDRKGLSENSSLRKYKWIGMTLSLALLFSIGIGIVFGIIIALIFW